MNDELRLRVWFKQRSLARQRAAKKSGSKEIAADASTRFADIEADTKTGL